MELGGGRGIKEEQRGEEKGLEVGLEDKEQ